MAGEGTGAITGAVTGEFTQLLAGLSPNTLSPGAMLAAKRVLLDASGVMLAASGLAPEVGGFVTLARAMGGGPCDILGTGHNASPAVAALANGAMAHALDYEDTFDPVPGHPNASLVPALLALAQWRMAHGAPVDGPRFIAALVAGCECSCRMALALRRKLEEGNWYPPPILAGHGAALGAAHLLGLDARAMADALSLALCQVTMPGEIKYSRRTVVRAIREAFPAQAAVQSALLAEQGLAGFEEPLEGAAGFYALYAGGQFAPDVLLASFDRGFWIEQLTFKQWPSCRGTHPFIEMALALRRDNDIAVEDIAQIRAGVGPVQHMLVEPLARKRAPDVAIDAKFSIPFCIASALVHGGIGLDSFSTERLADPATLALAAKVDCDQPDGAEGWRADAGQLEIRLTDGRRFAAVQDAARGAPHNALSDGELIEKFVSCAARAAQPLPERAARDLAGNILALEECGDVGALFVR